MKKLVFVFCLAIAAALCWYCLCNLKTNELNTRRDGNSSARTTSAITPERTVFKTNMFVATEATNIEQWKAAIKGFRDLGFGVAQAWQETQPDRTKGIPLLIRVGKGDLVFKSIATEVTGENVTGTIKEVSMESEIMDIAQTKTTGMQICDLLGYNSSDFKDWCDGIGTNWFDANPYHMKGRNVIGFRVLCSFDRTKPWIINLLIQPP